MGYGPNKVSRKTDVNSAGGRIVRGMKTFIANKLQVANVFPLPVSGHPTNKPHKPTGSPKTNVGLKTIITEKKKLNIVTMPDTCGHPRRKGSPDFIAGDKTP